MQKFHVIYETVRHHVGRLWFNLVWQYNSSLEAVTGVLKMKLNLILDIAHIHN